MKVITKEIPYIYDDGALLLPDKVLFLDIETMGFNAAIHPIYMIGTAYLSNAAAHITLYFAEVCEDEPSVLTAFFEQANDFCTLFTFNGRQFDLPYIKKRCDALGMVDPIIDYDNIDLYAMLRPLKSVLSLEHCRQKDIESFLGILREDQMSGGELIGVYKRYLKHPDTADYNLLVLHNMDDVAGMVRLIPMLSYPALSSAKLSSPTGTILAEEGRFLLTATLSVNIPRPLRFREDEYYLIIEKNRASCAFTLHKDGVHYFFDNPEDYVWLYAEARAIPKALASAIPKKEKRPALQAECFSPVSVSDAERATAFLSEYLAHILQEKFR